MTVANLECIYCRDGLTAATDKAHVWPASIGGRLASRSICCHECNNAISTIENHLRSALARAYASVGATNDEREPFSVKIEFEGHEFLLAAGNAVLQVEGSRFDRETKRMIVPLPAGLENQAEKTAKAMWSHGLGPDDIDKLDLVLGGPDPVLPEGPTASEHDINIGGAIEHKRTFVKMALELLAFHRHDLAMRGELSEARRFARHGTGTFQGKPDLRSHGSGLIPSDGLPEIYNAIEVWSFGRSVYFRAIFLGPIAFTGTLTTEWSGSAFRAAYTFDARDPANVVVNTFVEGDGPNLAIWIGDMKQETAVNAVTAIEEISLRLAQSKPRPVREPLPDIKEYRAAVREVLASMPPKKKKRK